MHLLIITIYIHLSWLCDLWLKIGYPKIPMFVIISSLNGYFILGIPHFRTNPTIPMFGCISHKLSYRIISHIPSFHFLWENHHILPIIFPWKPSSHGSWHGMAWQQKGLTSRRSVDAQQLPAGAAQATLLGHAEMFEAIQGPGHGLPESLDIWNVQWHYYIIIYTYDNYT